MRFNTWIAISVLVGALLLAILGVGIWSAPGEHSTINVGRPSFVAKLLRLVGADERGEKHEAIGPNDKAAITADQATAAALAAHPDTAAVRTTLEKERGMLLYSVKLNTGQEVKVDANSGQLLTTEREGDDDDD